MDPSWTVVLLLGLIVVLGALTQSIAGFGVAVVSAPFVVMLAPELMPGGMLVASLPLPLIELARNWREVDRIALSWALAGRFVTTPLGVAIVAWLSPNSIAVVVGVMVLVAVAGSIWAVDVRARPGPAFTAGVLTGVSGTAASIGGPFLGLVLQHERPQRLRATLAAFFVVGATTSLVALAAVGELTHAQVVAGLVWTPFVLLGLLLSIPGRTRLSPDRMRPVVLTLAAVAGVTVIIRALFLG